MARSLERSLGILVLGSLALGPPVARADDDSDEDPTIEAGDALADKGSASKKRSSKSKPSSKPAPASSGPDARPAPKPSSGDNARQPSPITPRVQQSPVPGQPGPVTTPNSAVRGVYERAPSQSVSLARREAIAPRPPLANAQRPYDAAKARVVPPPWRRPDHRYARPSPRHLRPHPLAPRPPPAAYFYSPWYTHWWVHPYYRHLHATWVVVHFDFVVHPWYVWWVPPPRYGWVWVPGYWSHGYWHPGYWRPAGAPPAWHGVTYVYVPGWWQGDVYVEGYWRPSSRADGDWVWIDGYYLEDGTYVPGHWRPAGYGPEGYVWEHGFFDGESWVGGFWRPEFYPGYVWVSSGFDDDGVYHAGYWEPLEERPGQVWIPGWFDGTQWIQGYWVSEVEYQAADPETWQPEAGWNDGWDDTGQAPREDEALPLAIPVEVEE